MRRMKSSRVGSACTTAALALSSAAFSFFAGIFNYAWRLDNNSWDPRGLAQADSPFILPAVLAVSILCAAGPVCFRRGPPRALLATATIHIVSLTTALSVASTASGSPSSPDSDSAWSLPWPASVWLLATATGIAVLNGIRLLLAYFLTEPQQPHDFSSWTVASPAAQPLFPEEAHEYRAQSVSGQTSGGDSLLPLHLSIPSWMGTASAMSHRPSLAPAPASVRGAKLNQT